MRVEAVRATHSVVTGSITLSVIISSVSAAADYPAVSLARYGAKRTGLTTSLRMPVWCVSTSVEPSVGPIYSRALRAIPEIGGLRFWRIAGSLLSSPSTGLLRLFP